MTNLTGNKTADALNYDDSQKLSRQLFEKYIQPRFLQLLPGEMYPVEGEVHPTLRMLDMTGGVDYFHVSKKTGCIRGFASRNQWCDRNWATFTVRETRESGARTELAKRRAAALHKGISPALTLQSYFSHQRGLLGFAIAREDDILSLIDKGFCTRKTTQQGQIGQATFAVVEWRDLIRLTRPLMIYDRSDATSLVYSKQGVRKYLDNLTDDEQNECLDAALSPAAFDPNDDMADDYEARASPWD